MRSVTGAAKKIERQQAAAAKAQPTADSFQNFISRVGLGTDNQSSGATYGFAPLTRERVKLEWMYRGSWLARRAVGCFAEDMTREWIKFGSTLPPDDGADLQRALIERYHVTSRFNDVIKWARLYGGAGAAMLIDGQDPKEPLRIGAIAKGSFNGLLVLDRWMLEPSLGDLVTDQKSRDLGWPKFYRVTADAPALPRMSIHHTRFLRFEGDDLPYWQRLTENLWGLSVLEPLYDRLVAFDSTTQGAAQLVYRAYLRYYKVPKLRELIASGGPMLEGLMQQLRMMRTFQTNEGLTVVDAEDDIGAMTYTFGGLSDVLQRFEEQLGGALDTPLVRLFGQSPGGLNSSGESDLRNYYDNVKNQQEKRFRPQISRLLPVVAASEGIRLPDDFTWDFVPLWQLTDEQKATVNAQVTGAVVQAHDAGIVSTPMALKELKQSSEVTGVWTNVTDEDIEEAEAAPPMPEMGGAEGEPPKPGVLPGEGESKLARQPAAAPNGVLPGEKPADARPRLRLVKDALYGHIAELPISIETPKGTARTAVDGSWSVIMPADYGYITRTSGADGEAVDCYVGPDRDSRHVWVIDQCHADTREFDEHKCMLGYKNEISAVKDYKAGFSDGRGSARMMRTPTHMTMDEFKAWLESADLKKPVVRSDRRSWGAGRVAAT